MLSCDINGWEFNKCIDYNRKIESENRIQKMKFSTILLALVGVALANKCHDKCGDVKGKVSIAKKTCRIHRRHFYSPVFSSSYLLKLVNSKKFLRQLFLNFVTIDQ